MNPPRTSWTSVLLFVFLATIQAGCGWYDLFTAPPLLHVPRMPSDADIERMQQLMMGEVFTSSLLNGLKTPDPYWHRPQVITVSELQTYVIDQVRKLTQGGQNPTIRRENLENDFVVY